MSVADDENERCCRVFWASDYVPGRRLRNSTVGRIKHFDINAISDLRLSQPWMRSPANSFRFHDPRTVAFNYGMRTYWIGKGGVDEAESEAIFAALREDPRLRH